jgi:hypothetical protein
MTKLNSLSRVSTKASLAKFELNICGGAPLAHTVEEI